MKHILLAVTGLNPQVITETLFALHQQGRQIDAIHVITTRKGRDEVYSRLLAPHHGWYHRYLREYRLETAAIDFGIHTVHTIRDHAGIDVEDITGEDENEAVLRTCLDFAFRFTQDPESRVFFSIAGGRKTMSACLMVAAQICGRPQDRVLHVLVSPEFESNPNFFFPPRKSVKVELRDEKGQPFIKETRFADVNLMTIPFLSIRDRLPRKMLEKVMDPATLMLAAVRESPARLTIDLTNRRINYKRHEFDMTPARLALYVFFALEKKACHSERTVCKGCHDCYRDIQGVFDGQERISELYRRITGRRGDATMSDTGILGLNAENFNSYKSKIQRDLEKTFGIYALRELGIESVGMKPSVRYGLRIDRDRIKVVF